MTVGAITDIPETDAIQDADHREAAESTAEHAIQGEATGRESLGGRSTASPAEAFRLGCWLVQPQLNEISHEVLGESRHLEPRLSKLLSFLAANQGELVERDVLVSLLWPKVIVNENSLTRAVSELRKQLNHPEQPETVYIETIPKKGYRLVEPAEYVGKKPASVPRDSNSPTAPLPLLTPLYNLQKSGSAALGLTLVLTLLLHFDTVLNQPEPVLLSDEVIASAQDSSLLSDVDVTLSSASGIGLESLLGGNLSDPIYCEDGKHFAYIKYDHTGSTILFGEVERLTALSAANEAETGYQPTVLYNSKDIIYNLTWSPLGDALLFASKPAKATAAMFGVQLEHEVELHSLDLATLEASVLVQRKPGEVRALNTELNLT